MTFDIEINTNNIKLEKIHLKNEKIDDFNIFRLNIIKKINENQIIQNLLFKILSDKLYKLFGTDISVQKNINLVIQRPDDDSRAIIHTDAPPESPYQVNFWIPLVDCKNTMSMYFFTPDKNGKIRSLYEPVHGSAPDIAEKNIANPIATILSLSMALRYSLDLDKEADLLDKAVQSVLDENLRTKDIMLPGKKLVSTTAMGDAIISKLK